VQKIQASISQVLDSMTLAELGAERAVPIIPLALSH
jgi:hypothetical protein